MALCVNIKSRVYMKFYFVSSGQHIRACSVLFERDMNKALFLIYISDPLYWAGPSILSPSIHVAIELFYNFGAMLPLTSMLNWHLKILVIFKQLIIEISLKTLSKLPTLCTYFPLYNKAIFN